MWRQALGPDGFDNFNLRELGTSDKEVTAKRKHAELPNELDKEIREIHSRVSSFNQDDAVSVGRVSLRDVQLRRKEILRQRYAQLRSEMMEERIVQENMQVIKNAVRSAVKAGRDHSSELLRYKETRYIYERNMKLKETETAMRKLESEVRDKLSTKDAWFERSVDHTGESVVTSVNDRLFDIRYKFCPRLLRVRVDWLRAVRNKLPAGDYIVRGSVRTRLGGHILEFSRHRKALTANNTAETPSARGPAPDRLDYRFESLLPVYHDGEVSTVELSFGEKQNRLFIPCPAAASSSASMCLVLEIVQVFRRPSMASAFIGEENTIGGSSHAAVQNNSDLTDTDLEYDPTVSRVWGWTAIPLCSAAMELIQGRVKLPIIRGAVSDDICKYSDINVRIARNLDAWLCNAYVSLREWPAYSNTQVRRTVVLRNCVGKTGEATDMPEDIGGVQSDDSGDSDDSDDDFPRPAAARTTTIFSTKMKLPSRSTVRYALQSEEMKGRQGALTVQKDFLRSIGANIQDMDDEESPAVILSQNRMHEDAQTIFQRKRVVLDSYRHSLGIYNGVVDMDSSSPFVPSLSAFAGLFDYVSSRSARPGSMSSAKGRAFLTTELCRELGVLKPVSFRFLLCSLYFLCWLWVALLMHYVGQIFYLEMVGVDLLSSSFQGLWFDLEYSVDNANWPSVIQAMMFVSGNLTPWVIVFLIAFCVGFGQAMQHRDMPHFFSVTLILSAFGQLIHPLLVLVVDLIRRNNDGDYFRLHNTMEERYGTGVVGILVTIASLCIQMFFSYLLLRFIALRLYGHGRLLDLFQRLHGSESEFVIPEDYEVSIHELLAIVNSSRKHRPASGHRRLVYSQMLTFDNARQMEADELGNAAEVAATALAADEADGGDEKVVSRMSSGEGVTDGQVMLKSSNKKSVMHVVVMDQSPSGLRQVHRQFIRRDDGTILELFKAAGDVLAEDPVRSLEQQLVSGEFFSAQDALTADAAEGFSATTSPNPWSPKSP